MKTERISKNAQQRAYRMRTGNAATKRYEKTKNGFLMRAYRNMQSRVSGIQWRKAHLYAGYSILSKNEFCSWSLSNDDFHRLFDHWVRAGYERTLTPSVNRKDTQFGYQLENMEWITHSENSKLGALSQKRNYEKKRSHSPLLYS